LLSFRTFSLSNVPKEMSNEIPGRRKAEKWLSAGDQAVRNGDSPSLQEAVKHLWKLQPKSDVDLDKEQAMQAGLRKF
jgi:hypothetical protein